MREIVRVYVRGRIDARLSVCILHLAHDWNWIHLEAREVLSLTDSSFQIVKNHKQTVHVGSCSYNSAMLRGDKGCRKPSGFHTRSRKHHWLRPLIPPALYTAPHELILILYCVLQWNSKHTWRHTGMSRGCPSMLKLFFFFDFSLVFSLFTPLTLSLRLWLKNFYFLSLKMRIFTVFAGSLPFHCAFPKTNVLQFKRQGSCINTRWNLTSAKQARCS